MLICCYAFFAAVAIVPGGLDKPDMVLTPKSTLERTQEWAEKAAAALLLQTQTAHRTSSLDISSLKDIVSSSASSGHHHRSDSQHSLSGVAPPVAVESPMSSPSALNPRDIPLEHRGGAARDPRDTPRDPRDHSPHPQPLPQQQQHAANDRTSMGQGRDDKILTAPNVHIDKFDEVVPDDRTAASRDGRGHDRDVRKSSTERTRHDSDNRDSRESKIPAVDSRRRSPSPSLLRNTAADQSDDVMEHLMEDDMEQHNNEPGLFPAFLFSDARHKKISELPVNC